MGRFETGWLTSKSNLDALADRSGARIDRVHARRPQTSIMLDMDSSVSETHGAQEGSANNGHFACTCYHPLFVFNQFGDLERCSLRPGNLHNAADWRDVLEPVVARYRHAMKRRYYRGDAAYASPAIYEFLEDEGYKYTIRLPANAVLQGRIGWLLKRPVGRPPHAVRRHYASFSYQAASWNKPRRVVAKVEWQPGELYPRVGFIVTNMTRPPERATLFYNQRATAEQHIKEGKNAVTWTRLSCHRFAANAVRLQLHALAYNLANFLRTLTSPEAVGHWSMTTLRDRLVKIGARIIRHGRSITFQMAEVAGSRGSFQQMLDAIAMLRPLPPARC
jgi:Transposase DDE domain group 1